MSDYLYSVAVHEAGHVIVGHALGARPSYATVVHTREFNGRVALVEPVGLSAEDHAAIDLAGVVAQEMFASGATGSKGDMSQICSRLRCPPGSDERIAELVGVTVAGWITAYHILCRSAAVTKSLARRLVTDKTIDGDDIARLFEAMANSGNN